MWTPNKLSIAMWGCECIQIEPGIVLFDYFGHMHSQFTFNLLLAACMTYTFLYNTFRF